MSTYIVITITALLAILACYALISQSIEKRRIHKQRLLMALKTKHRNFIFLMNGFPQHFLTNDLLSLIYHALINTCEQLDSVEPQNPRHQDEIALFTNLLNALSKNAPPKKVLVENAEQMKEIRKHLLELQKFIQQQLTLRAINKAQAITYNDQIKRLALQMSVDAYIHHAKQAQQNSKGRLALHYFTLAQKMLVSENVSRAHDKEIAQINSIIAKLEENTTVENEVTATDKNSTTIKNKEWDNFDKNKETAADWKKKQVYD